MSQSTAELKQTPLNSVHRRMGARMVDFGGWDMPVQYSGILEEHHAVRNAVGLFDVSHMGEIEIRGPEAPTLVDYLIVTTLIETQDRVRRTTRGCCTSTAGLSTTSLYTGLTDDHFFICVNASNQEKDYDYISTAEPDEGEVEFASDRYCQIAVQGPKALETSSAADRKRHSKIRYYWFVDGEVNDVPARIARTGYTGEDGFEMYVAPERAESLGRTCWTRAPISASGRCGLGARNTLRLESKMALYGHEISASITPLEADLPWIVKFEKADFVGRAALEGQKAEGIRRKLMGFEMQGRGSAGMATKSRRRTAGGMGDQRRSLARR